LKPHPPEDIDEPKIGSRPTIKGFELYSGTDQISLAGRIDGGISVDTE
jgi:hypothetical protein